MNNEEEGSFVFNLLKRHWLWIAVNIGSLLPVLIVIWNYAMGNASVDPVDDLISRTGKPALVLLILSLACTPLNTIFGWRAVIKVRKSLGLYAFFYVCLHLLTFIGLDYGFDLGFILQAAQSKQRFIVAGFGAFLLLLPLAITSTKGWMRRLGRKWKKLHQLVYVAAGLAVLHYIWLVRLDLTEPLIFAAVLVILLLLRLTKVRKYIKTYL